MVPENLGRYFYRDNLKSEQAKHLYNEILTYFTHNYSTEVPVTFENMDEASQDIFCAAEALYYDWPELFFIGNSWRFLYTKEKPGRFIIEGNRYSAEQVCMVRFHMKRVRDYLLKGTEEEPVLRREQIIYERIAQLLRYDDRHERHDHTIVAPILRCTGVCEGINALLLLALRAAGIPAIKVIGCAKINGGGHAWAIAWPDLSTPVHLDATWDLTSSVSPDIVWENHGERCAFRYFNLSDRQISQDHDGYRKDYMPRCQKEYLNYDKICNI